MMEIIQPDIRVNSLVKIQNGAEDQSSSFLPVNGSCYEHISGLLPREAELPPWRLDGGQVNSLVKTF